jgi:hypothetical protein
MAYIVKQSTAIAAIALGPFLDEADGFTAMTGLTLTQPDIRLSKNGGAFAQKNAAQTLSHMENGYYSLALDTTDTATVGTLRIHSKESGALPVWMDLQVVEEAIYDAYFAASATGLLPANVTQWLGSAAATPTVAGVPEVDVTHWIGTAAATPTVAGVPEVDLTHVAGSTTSVSTIASSVATLLAAIGTLTDAAADGDPTTADTLMQYVKQLVNVLVGTAGVATFPASATPANAVSLAEVIRQIYDETAGLNGVTPPTAGAIADAVHDEVIDGTRTQRELTRGVAAALLGKVSGMDGNAPVFRDIADSKDVIDATTDSDGNRTAITLDLT